VVAGSTWAELQTAFTGEMQQKSFSGSSQSPRVSATSTHCGRSPTSSAPPTYPPSIARASSDSKSGASGRYARGNSPAEAGD
jgi:hypothetical protein